MPPAQFDTVILDVDGTLVDSNYQHALAWTVAFQAVGISIETWRLHRAVGMGADRLVAHVAGQTVEERVGDDIRDMHSREYANLHHTVRPLPGAEGLITELKQRGFTVALATSSAQEDFAKEMDFFDDAHQADVSLTLPDVSSTKPDPELLLKALEKAGGTRAVTIGDTTWDMESAREAGVLPIALLTGGFSREELLAAGAEEVFESLDELRRRIDDTPLGTAAS
jgi:HAD superfamily hydrolase (TIGR01509 family)